MEFSHILKEKLLQILHDDLGRGDVTSHIVPVKHCRAKIIAKEDCIVAGLEEARFLFHYRHVHARQKAKDGSAVKRGRVVLELNGKNINIFEVERTALNIIARMSAVASACSLAKNIAGKKVTVALTRKTMPGFNLFDNKAAELAGVWTHRINLNSFVLIKDNHLGFFERASDAVLEARRVYGNGMLVEIEVESRKQAFDAMLADPGILMLDNFSPAGAKGTVKALREKGFCGRIELSGGINLENLREYAKCGADIISMGSLTQAVYSKNFSLELF